MSSFFKVACPKCKKSLKVNENLAGKSRACPYCRATVRIPDLETPETELASSLPSIQVADVTPAGKPRVKVDADAAATGTVRPAKARKKIKRNRSEKTWFSSGSRDSASSDVSLVLSGLMGILGAAIWYAAMYPLANAQIQFGQLFWDRGPVPFPTTFLMFWAIAILILKWLNLKKQKDAMLLDVLPVEVSQEITVGSLDGFIDHINDLPGASTETFLVNRVIRGIEHFRVRKSAAETVTMMESQSAIDANNVAGSYIILKVFIWSLPILGFIGTVMGVSQAVASLGTGMNSGGMDGMKESLNTVFGGLGTAFDTTLLALIMSMLVKIPASAIQKSEEDLITSVDEYCNENLLRRLNDGREGFEAAAANSDTSVFRQAVEEAMGTQHAEMERWLGKLDAIGTRLSSQVGQGWDQVNEKIQRQQQAHVKTLNEQQLDQQARLQAQLDQMANAADKIQATLSQLSNQAESMQNDVTGSFAGASESLQANFEGLSRGLNSLSSVLEKLGDQQVVVQQVESAPTKTGWFGGSKKSRKNVRS